MSLPTLFPSFLFTFTFAVVALAIIIHPASASLPPSAVSLVKFRDSLPQASRDLLPWNQSDSSPPCSWLGVSCYPDHEYLVKSLNFSGLGLSGNLHHSVSHLCGLKGLSYLDLSGNSLSGLIPSRLGNCSEIKTLYLNGNHFHGSIPAELFRARHLVELDLGNNSLAGRIPAEVGLCSRLQYLGLYNNLLTGLPPQLGNCSSLSYLELQNNLLEGPIPPEICMLENLEVLDMFNNSLQGNIPPQIVKMKSLTQLALYDNNLSGRIPAEIAQLRNLRLLQLDGNHLTGELPSDLGQNMFLHLLDLTGNDLYGQLPSQLCAGNSLTVLAVGNNRFNGTFPVGITRCKSLKRVILSHNRFHGILPQTLSQNPAISYLDLKGNLLGGSIPPGLGVWSKLSTLDISDNKFSGSIPSELGKLSYLQTLQASANKLSGTIPTELGNCSKLNILNLSSNHLSGSIPKEVVSLPQLHWLLLQENRLTGEIPDSFLSFQNLYNLDIGGNMLEGSIPPSLSYLPHFSYLNLSSNRLTGEIPWVLGKLDKLEILDLSNNNLSGKIPSDVNNMRALLYVNVSFNRLSGTLPASWLKLLASLPSSFVGNPELCVQANEADHCQKSEKRNSQKSRGKILAAVIVGVFLLTLGLCLVICLFVVQVHRRWDRLQFVADDVESSGDLPQDLKFEDILRATEGFSEEYVIGRGKHGTVYRAQMENGKVWAVKKMEMSEVSFTIEMKTMNLIRHRNLVKTAGYCIRGGFGFIVYEYMPRGSLFEVLHRSKPCMPLDWKVRHLIALGIAQGLSYLHHDCVPQIIHRDVKANNVLLDSELEPRIGDFGMAKLVNDPDANSTLSSIVGTLGYIAPEYGHTTRLSAKCDVYSYGVILLELLCRKMPVDPSFEEDLDIVAWTCKNMQVADPFSFLDDEINYWEEDDKSKALKLLTVAISCTQLAPYARPSMRDIVTILIKLNS